MGEVLNKISNKVIEIIKTLYQKIVSGIKSLYLPAAIASVVVFIFSLIGGNEGSTLQKVICIFVLIAVIVLSYYNENNKKHKVFLPILLCVLAVFNSFVFFRFEVLNGKSKGFRVKRNTNYNNEEFVREEKKMTLSNRGGQEVIAPVEYTLYGDEEIEGCKCIYFFTSANVKNDKENKSYKIYTNILGRSRNSVICNEKFKYEFNGIDNSRGFPMFKYDWIVKSNGASYPKGIRLHYKIKLHK